MGSEALSQVALFDEINNKLFVEFDNDKIIIISNALNEIKPHILLKIIDTRFACYDKEQDYNVYRAKKDNQSILIVTDQEENINVLGESVKIINCTQQKVPESWLKNNKTENNRPVYWYVKFDLKGYKHIDLIRQKESFLVGFTWYTVYG